MLARLPMSGPASKPINRPKIYLTGLVVKLFVDNKNFDTRRFYILLLFMKECLDFGDW